MHQGMTETSMPRLEVEQFQAPPFQAPPAAAYELPSNPSSSPPVDEVEVRSGDMCWRAIQLLIHCFLCCRRCGRTCTTIQEAGTTTGPMWWAPIARTSSTSRAGRACGSGACVRACVCAFAHRH